MLLYPDIKLEPDKEMVIDQQRIVQWTFSQRRGCLTAVMAAEDAWSAAAPTLSLLKISMLEDISEDQ